MYGVAASFPAEAAEAMPRQAARRRRAIERRTGRIILHRTLILGIPTTVMCAPSYF